MYNGIIEKYKNLLPLSDNTKIISLQEGNTPLIRLKNLPQELEVDLDIWVKVEGANPTGSFKDRGMCFAVTKAVEAGAKTIICASTGNTSAAAAAYAAAAGIKCIVLIPAGKIALGKLAQAIVLGAKIVQISGNFDDAMEMVKEISSKHKAIALVNSVNPYRLEGQKTAAFEIVDSLGFVPDYHALPVGNAGNISAYWMGYKEYSNFKNLEKLPVMLGYQAGGANPFVRGEILEAPETIATAVRIGKPQSWDKAIAAQKESSGWFRSFSDQDILKMQGLLARFEGVFCEPASILSLCGVLADYKDGKIKKDSTVVCTLTGNGLKDPDSIIKNMAGFKEQMVELDSISEIYNVLNLG